MGTWNSRGLRGSTLEEMINLTNEKYRSQGLALIQKVPTPITPIKMNEDHTQITLAYFEKKSTIDYIGAVQGIPVCFDAKECNSDRFPLANIHEHQMVFMRDMEKQDGVAFIIAWFTHVNEFYYIPYLKLVELWNRGKSGGKKSFSRDELDRDYMIKVNGNNIHYLETVKRDLESRV
ncbi:MAG: Holliday junction resolvase RecU [Lachnospiraceae bacterium]|nr:Holliday junction resolvase RecU [Lachnospiraceae bacterium]